MPQPGMLSLPIPEKVVKELRIEKAHAEKNIAAIVAEAWDLYKEANPAPWRTAAKKKNVA